MVTFGERATHLVFPMLSLYYCISNVQLYMCIFILVISHFGFYDRTLVLIVLVTVHCLLFTSVDLLVRLLLEIMVLGNCLQSE